MSPHTTVQPVHAIGFATLQELLDSSPWYPKLASAVQARVRAEMSQQAVPAGATLVHRGEIPHHWFGVISGLLKRSISNADGSAITYGVESPGSWFGEGTLWRGLPRSFDVIALRPSIVAMMPRGTFEWLYESELMFSHFLIQQINERMFWLGEDWAAHRTMDADGRVKRALVGLFHPWLRPHRQLHIELSQEEVANLAGVSRPRCNRALKRLQDGGLLKLEYGGLTVLDLDGLRRAAVA